MSNPDDICAALHTLRSRLDTLASITATNITIPSGPQEHYHQIIEEAYAAYGLIETEVDALEQELACQHMRLDDLRDGVLADEQHATNGHAQSIDHTYWTWPILKVDRRQNEPLTDEVPAGCSDSTIAGVSRTKGDTSWTISLVINVSNRSIFHYSAETKTRCSQVALSVGIVLKHGKQSVLRLLLK